MSSMKIAFIFSCLFSYAVCNINNGVNFRFKGVIAPVFTPINNDKYESLNLMEIYKTAKFLASKNVFGILAAGICGEGTSLTVAERKNVAQTWKWAAEKANQHLMIAVGGLPLKYVKELASHAEGIGVDSLLVLPDLYEKPSSTEDVIDYLKLVGEAAPNTPLLYYDSKIFGVKIDHQKFFANVGKKVPNFVGLKYVPDNATELTEVWEVKNQYKVIVASNEFTLAGCVLGADSIMSATTGIVPEKTYEILKYCHSMNNYEKAEIAQDYINKLTKEIYSYGNNIVTPLKVATSIINNLRLGPPRAPLKPLPLEKVNSMAESLSKFNLVIHKNAALNH